MGAPQLFPDGPLVYTARVRRLCGVLLILIVVCDVAGAQTRRRRTPAPTPVRAAAEVHCPAVLGVGLQTRRRFCDVLSTRKPEEGVIIKVPPHRGTAVLSFDLHNRHTYSEEQVRTRRAYTSYTATVMVAALDGTLLARAVVQNEFRTAADLLDRIPADVSGSAVKAVAPIGLESVVVELPAEVEAVSLLGEKVFVVRLDDRGTYSASGRPIAVVSNVMVEFMAAPPARNR